MAGLYCHLTLADRTLIETQLALGMRPATIAAGLSRARSTITREIRGREAVRLYTDDKAAMLDAVKHSGARLSASELMGDPEPKHRQRVPVMQRLFKPGGCYFNIGNARSGGIRDAACDRCHGEGFLCKDGGDRCKCQYG